MSAMDSRMASCWGFAFGEAMHGVAHHQRGFGRVDDDDGLALLGAAHLLDRARGGAGEFVDVLARAGAGRSCSTRWRRSRRRPPAARGDTAATIGIVAWPPQVTMLTFISPLPTCSTQVDRRHAEGADRGRGEVDHQHAQLIELAAVLGMHVGAGGVEGDLHAVGQHVGQQAIDAVGGGLDAHLAGALEAVGVGVDADHPHRLQHRAALEFGQQVGADVAGADQGAFDFLVMAILSCGGRKRPPKMS
jgi:hypothetical protein